MCLDLEGSHARPQLATLLKQLTRFPYSAHDDGPDALAMAVTMVKKVPMAQGCIIAEGGEW